MTAKTAPVKSVVQDRTHTANGTCGEGTFSTQNFHVKGEDEHGAWKETRIEAQSKDHAIGIAHERNIRVSECVQIETKI